ncbi:MAG: dihydrofolate reductase family protein [Alphaproteobacteria bacterium]|nr:dihydrofolate reductase family protein [Alphaproteobacteria bacterium]
MPEVIFYMASSLNGLICRTDDKTNFVSDDEWKHGFIPIVDDVKSMIMGRKTYEVMCDSNEFNHLHKDLFVVVVTKQNNFQTKNNNHVIATSPEEALDEVTEKGFERTLISGGTILNSSFLQQRLVDKVIVDIEPILVADGKQLFKTHETDIDLKLLDIKKLTDDLIQVHYKVRK